MRRWKRPEMAATAATVDNKAISARASSINRLFNFLLASFMPPFISARIDGAIFKRISSAYRYIFAFHHTQVFIMIPRMHVSPVAAVAAAHSPRIFGIVALHARRRRARGRRAGAGERSGEIS